MREGGIAPRSEVTGPGALQVRLTDTKGVALSDEDRIEIAKSFANMPWYVRPLAEDPVGFRAKLFEIMPRVFFAMLPLFAGSHHREGHGQCVRLRADLGAGVLHHFYLGLADVGLTA